MAQKSSQVGAKKAASKPIPVKAKTAKVVAKPLKSGDKAKAVLAHIKPAVVKPQAQTEVAPALLKPVKPINKANSRFNAPIKKLNSKDITKVKAAAPKEEATAGEPVVTKGASKKSRKISIEASAGEAASALSAKWNSLFKKADQIDAKPYNMKAMFEEKTAITHKVLGWGYILANRNDRLEVLFKDGIKYLISNYKT